MRRGVTSVTNHGEEKRWRKSSIHCNDWTKSAINRILLISWNCQESVTTVFKTVNTQCWKISPKKSSSTTWPRAYLRYGVFFSNLSLNFCAEKSALESFKNNVYLTKIFSLVFPMELQIWASFPKESIRYSIQPVKTPIWWPKRGFVSIPKIEA